MMTHMGYLPDIGRWLVWGAVGVVVLVLVGVVLINLRWKYGGYKNEVRGWPRSGTRLNGARRNGADRMKRSSLRLEDSAAMSRVEHTSHYREENWSVTTGMRCWI